MKIKSALWTIRRFWVYNHKNKYSSCSVFASTRVWLSRFTTLYTFSLLWTTTNTSKSSYGSNAKHNHTDKCHCNNKSPNHFALLPYYKDKSYVQYVPYYLQLHSLAFPEQWLHGHPSGHWHMPANAVLTSVDIFVMPIPTTSALNNANETKIFFTVRHLLVIKRYFSETFVSLVL